MALADPLQLVVMAIVALLALTFADGVVCPSSNPASPEGKDRRL